VLDVSSVAEPVEVMLPLCAFSQPEETVRDFCVVNCKRNGAVKSRIGVGALPGPAERTRVSRSLLYVRHGKRPGGCS